jgi:transposase
MLMRQAMTVSGEIAVLDRQLLAWHAQSEASRRLSGIPGLGILTATALAATATDLDRFQSGRQFAAGLGLTPQRFPDAGFRRLRIAGERAEVTGIRPHR